MNNNGNLEAMITRIVFKAVDNALKINNLAQLSAQYKGEELPFDINEAAKITNLTKGTIYGLVCKNKIPFIKSTKRGKLYFYKSELLTWLTDVPKTQSESLIAEEV